MTRRIRRLSRKQKIPWLGKVADPLAVDALSSSNLRDGPEPQDMRRSFDALALAVKEQLGLEPQSGALFVFASKRANRIKVLWFDRNGYCILCKRLHGARFVLPSSSLEARSPRIISSIESDSCGSLPVSRSDFGPARPSSARC